jgi:ion channel-forming bestrophin family protein
MIKYKNTDWWTFIFRFHRTDTFRQLLPLIITIGLYSAAVCYIELNYINDGENALIKNLTMMHSLLGFVISLLLAYRTNTAYDRWWEGRRQWGELNNSARNMAIKLSSILKTKSDKVFFSSHIAAYAKALALHLMNEKTYDEIFNLPQQSPIDPDKHPLNQIAQAMYAKINTLYNADEIKGFELQLLNQDLQNFTNVCGACERIKNTPIPFSYSSFIKKFIFFYVMTLPFGYSVQLGYVVVPMVIFVFYVLASLELIAEEIEDPFGGDDNDLPTEKMAENIGKNVNDLLL